MPCECGLFLLWGLRRRVLTHNGVGKFRRGLPDRSLPSVPSVQALRKHGWAKSASAASWFIYYCVECPIVLLFGFNRNLYENDIRLDNISINKNRRNIFNIFHFSIYFNRFPYFPYLSYFYIFPYVSIYFYICIFSIIFHIFYNAYIYIYMYMYQYRIVYIYMYWLIFDWYFIEFNWCSFVLFSFFLANIK